MPTLDVEKALQIRDYVLINLNDKNRLTATHSRSVLWNSEANMFLCVCKAVRVSEALDAARADVDTPDSIRRLLKAKDGVVPPQQLAHY